VIALHPCRDCVQQLLTCGGDSMAYNRDDNLPCDLGSSGSQVWTMLERDMQWRTCLQVRCYGHGWLRSRAEMQLSSSRALQSLVVPATQWAPPSCIEPACSNVILHNARLQSRRCMSLTACPLTARHILRRLAIRARSCGRSPSRRPRRWPGAPRGQRASTATRSASQRHVTIGPAAYRPVAHRWVLYAAIAQHIYPISGSTDAGTARRASQHHT